MSEPVAPARRGSVVTGFIAVGIAAMLIAAAAAVFVLQDPQPEITGLAPATPSPFDGNGEIVAGPNDAWFSPDGTRLAVLSEGSVALAEEGALARLTSRGGNVVDAAWFGAGTALLVAEGPTPTGAMAIVERDGTVRGSIPLDPPVSFGDGLGMSIAPGGKRAVVTAVERDPFGARSTRLVAVDLTTGVTAPIATGAGDARDPHHVSAQALAFTRVVDGEERAIVLDLASGAEVTLGPGTVRGVIGAGETIAVEHEGTLIAYQPAGERAGELHAGLEGAVVAVHPSGASAVVAILRDDAVVLTEISLERGGST